MLIKLDSHIEVQPFRVPNFAMLKKTVSTDLDRDEKVPLAAISAEDLERLCDNFRSEVFRKAGKEFPPKACNCDCHD